MRSLSVIAQPLQMALIGLLLGSGIAIAEPGDSDKTGTQTTEVEASKRFSPEKMLARCERFLPICQPAIAWHSMEAGISNLRDLPTVRPIPTLRLDPRLSHSMTALATGLILRTARDLATDPFSLDPIRYFSPAQRDMVGIHTTADQLGELAHPILGSNSFRPTPKASEDSDSD